MSGKLGLFPVLVLLCAMDLNDMVVCLPFLFTPAVPVGILFHMGLIDIIDAVVLSALMQMDGDGHDEAADGCAQDHGESDEPFHQSYFLFLPRKYSRTGIHLVYVPAVPQLTVS